MTDQPLMNEIEKELLASVSEYRDQLKEETDTATIALLEPIMRSLGIWPNELMQVSIKASPGFAYRYQDLFDASLPSTFIENRHAIAIVRDAAEDWLKRAPRFVDYGWSRETGETVYVFLSHKMVPVEMNSLLAALEYTERNHTNDHTL